MGCDVLDALVICAVAATRVWENMTPAVLQVHILGFILSCFMIKQRCN